MQENTPFLTIGIASYNYSKYLTRAFEMIKVQKFKDFELLYCDDGSTDDSISVIEGIIQDNPDMTIRLIKGENEGIISNKNRIIDNAKGKYILLCDADDYMKENALEILCERAKATDADCVIAGFEEIDGVNNRVIKKHTPNEKSSKWIYIWHHSQMYKTDILRENNIRIECEPDDISLTQRMHLYAKNVQFINESIYVWIRHYDSTSKLVAIDSAWCCVTLWRNIVSVTSDILLKVDRERDRKELSYFIYKWYFFNILDISLLSEEYAKKAENKIREEMLKVLPQYKKLSVFLGALKTSDSFIAKVSVWICWILERFGLIKLSICLRKCQYNK